MIAPNKTANTITVRATANVASIIEKVIEANDNPRAEIVVDVQILEVNRSRAKQFGLDLCVVLDQRGVLAGAGPASGRSRAPGRRAGGGAATPTAPTAGTLAVRPST